MNDTPSTKNRLYQAAVALTVSELQAIEAWRQAQGIADQADALRLLVQQGLLKEIRELYENSESISLELVQRALGQSED